MAFPPRLGCPMCGMVATASHQAHFQSSLAHPEILWRDENWTAYRERTHPVSSHGHIVIVFNSHVPSIYALSSSDVPLLVFVRELAHRLLAGLLLSPLPHPEPTVLSPLSQQHARFRVGFITPPFRDSKIPVTDHIHVHAYIAPADLMGWFRSIAYGPIAWYAIDDLIAEIRESTSNNRVKSGYQNRSSPAIDKVPSAGARSGTAAGVETSKVSVTNVAV